MVEQPPPLPLAAAAPCSINLKPDFASSYMYLGITLARLEDVDNACSAYDKVRAGWRSARGAASVSSFACSPAATGAVPREGPALPPQLRGNAPRGGPPGPRQGAIPRLRGAIQREPAGREACLAGTAPSCCRNHRPPIRTRRPRTRRRVQATPRSSSSASSSRRRSACPSPMSPRRLGGRAAGTRASRGACAQACSNGGSSAVPMRRRGRVQFCPVGRFKSKLEP